MKLKFALLALAAMGVLAASMEAQSYAITNARIVTVSGPTIERGTVVVRDGLIASVGVDAKAPSDAQVFDGTGLTVYPGFIDALTNVGMQTRTQTPTPAGGGAGAGLQQATPQTNSNYPAGLRPELIAADDLRGGDAQFDTVRNAGFTTVVTVGRTGIFNGRSVIIDLAGENVSGMIVREPFAEHVSFTTIGGGYPGSLLGTFSALRQMFLDAQRLQELQKMYASNPRGMKRPDSDQSLEALFPIINRQMPIVFNANREIEIVRALDFAKEFNLKAIIGGGQEAWKVADRLKALDVPVLLSLNFPKRTAAASPDADPDTMDLLRFRAETPKAAAKLQQAGVKFAFQSGGATALADFFTNAGKAVENGLSRDVAVRSMTLGSAEILGVGDRLGSIETGKIANLTVVKGDLLGKDRVVANVFVDGRPFEQKLPAEKPTAARPPVSAPGALPQVAGNYSITIEIPGQQLTGTLALTQQAAVLTGSLQTQLGTSPLKAGKVTPEGFSFSVTVELGGSQTEINAKGTVSANQVTGTMDLPQGTVPFTGTRNP
ncbi:MAG TPA: amidohydrolase family protein [Pyrinomonadaceae bacterium]|nr:amidohydrolase family protein [Pyrinomonadaceae bacterium]